MKKYGIGLLSIAILIASFLICRFALFDMHKMKQFPLVLLIAGRLFIGISMLFGCSRCRFSHPLVTPFHLPQG